MVMPSDNKPSAKAALRLAVRVYDEYGRMRTAMGNRAKIKKSGEDQKIPEAQQDTWAITGPDRELFLTLYKDALDQEAAINKFLRQHLKQFPVYTEYLSGIPGVAESLSAVIISEYDIHRATTVSKMWQYTGVNPGLVRGRKVIKAKDYKPSHGDIIGHQTGKHGEQLYVVRTWDYIRGDRLTPGYLSPFNQRLRAKMVGVLGGQLINQNPYYRNIYINERMRLIYQDMQETGKDESKYYTLGSDGKPDWKKGYGHMHARARRKMVKQFILDLYVAWRTLEGLPVREPYKEEYLSKTHSE